MERQACCNKLDTSGNNKPQQETSLFPPSFHVTSAKQSIETFQLGNNMGIQVTFEPSKNDLQLHMWFMYTDKARFSTTYEVRKGWQDGWMVRVPTAAGLQH